MNLAVNARDAMPEGGHARRSPSAGARRRRRGSPSRDDGVGHGRRTFASARFEPFFTTKEPGEGTGLGLATVHGVVTDAGGIDRDRLGGRRRHGRDVFLPAATGTSPRAEEPDAPRRRAAGGASVLVVEDQDPVRRQACRILEAHGYSVREAAERRRGARALGAGRRAVTDVVMPGMSGQQLAEHARRACARPARRLHVRPHRRRRRPRRRAPRRHRVRAEALHARLAAARGRGGAREQLPGFRLLVGMDAAGAGRPAHILDRLSKSLEWSGSSRHDASSGGLLSTLPTGIPAVSRCTDPPAPRDPCACGAGAPQRRRLARSRADGGGAVPYDVAAGRALGARLATFERKCGRRSPPARPRPLEMPRRIPSGLRPCPAAPPAALSIPHVTSRTPSPAL